MKTLSKLIFRNTCKEYVDRPISEYCRRNSTYSLPTCGFTIAIGELVEYTDYSNYIGGYTTPVKGAPFGVGDAQIETLFRIDLRERFTLTFNR